VTDPKDTEPADDPAANIANGTITFGFLVAVGALVFATPRVWGWLLTQIWRDPGPNIILKVAWYAGAAVLLLVAGFGLWMLATLLVHGLQNGFREALRAVRKPR
jgi:hypothetical protein